MASNQDDPYRRTIWPETITDGQCTLGAAERKACLMTVRSYYSNEIFILMFLPKRFHLLAIGVEPAGL